MQIFTKLFACKKNAPGRAVGVNLWRQWVGNPKAIRWLLRDEDALRLDDLDTVESWAGRQREWGLHVRLHASAAGLPQVVEVFGPDLTEPHVLLYRVGEEIQVDEHHGASRRYADMAEAVDFVANHT